MSTMAMGPEVPELPEVPEVPGALSLDGSRLNARTVAVSLALLAGSVLSGLLGGLIWGEVAPRVLYQKISPGVAEVVNDETRAFFGADAWFCLIALLAGLLTGVLGYRFGVARRAGLARAAAATALILGALGGGLAMMWLGGQIGLSGYNHQLGSSPDGTLFPASLALGAKSALACWPLFTSVVLVIAEWGTRPAPAKGEPAD